MAGVNDLIPGRKPAYLEDEEDEAPETDDEKLYRALAEPSYQQPMGADIPRSRPVNDGGIPISNPDPRIESMRAAPNSAAQYSNMAQKQQELMEQEQVRRQATQPSALQRFMLQQQIPGR